MARFCAIALAIWFVVAVSATQPVRSDLFGFISAGLAKERLLSEEAMSIDDIKKEIATIMKDEQMSHDEIISVWSADSAIDVSTLNAMARENVRGCHRKFLSSFRAYIKKAEKYPNVKKFFEYLYEPKLKQCEDWVLFGVREFKIKKSEGEQKLEEFYNAIKSNEQLYGQLKEEGSRKMKEEMMSALGDVLKAKSPDAENDYETKALEIMRRACKHIESEYEFQRSIELVSKLGPRIKEEEELADYIGQLRLCRLAKTQSNAGRDEYADILKIASELRNTIDENDRELRRLEDKLKRKQGW